MEVALVRADTHTCLRSGCKTPRVQPRLTSHQPITPKQDRGMFGSCHSSVFLLALFRFLSSGLVHFQAGKSFPSAKGMGVPKGCGARVQTCQGHLQSCGKGSEKTHYCKGWFQLHLTAGPVFICAGWQGKGEPFMCWLPAEAEGTRVGREAALSWVREHPNSPKASGPPTAATHPGLTREERGEGRSFCIQR